MKNLRNLRLIALLALSTVLLAFSFQKEARYDTDVLVVNGGAGGVAAGLQSARLGVKTLIVEPTEWLGGMLTAAGVSATDGNHQMPAGIWGEFRQKLWNHYGGPDAIATGWVSNTQFEPSIGARFFRQMAEAEPQLTVWYRARLVSLKKIGAGWEARVAWKGKTSRVTCKMLVDGTDLGDVAKLAGAQYDLGMDSRDVTGESMAPAKANDIIQDLTLVAILKDFGPGADKTIPRPAGYNPEEFRCSCRDRCPENQNVVNCEMMITYGKLPNNKYMINWPASGNDYYTNVVEASEKEREAAFNAARLHTLRFVYYLQTELGHKNLGLADDEFPTQDKLAFYPYHREGRRIRGIARVTVKHVLEPYATPLYRSGAIVGDYPIDHHHHKYPNAPEIDFPKVPSFNLPLSALIPEKVDNLVMADKAISVSNIVNGSSRLQPVVLQIGQAAGALAAMAVKQGTTPRQLDVREVQKTLLGAGAYLMPFFDVKPADPHFQAIQRVGATGILRGRGQPYNWANRTWFDADTTINWTALNAGLAGLPVSASTGNASGTALVTVAEAVSLTADLLRKAGKPTGLTEQQAQSSWTKWGLSNFQPQRPVTKRELAVMLDATLDPFSLWKVDWKGEWKKG